MKSQLKRFGALALAGLLASLMLFSLMAGIYSVVRAGNGPGVPDSGSVASSALRTWYTNPITGSGTVYGNTSSETGSGDVSTYHKMDLFSYIDISGTATITVTPQFSPDNVNWYTATYAYENTSSSGSTTCTFTQTNTATDTVTNTNTVTSTATISNSVTATATSTGTLSASATTTGTCTTTSSGSTTISTANYQYVLDADGETNHQTLRTTGMYFRVKIVYTTTGTFTPTIRAVMRND